MTAILDTKVLAFLSFVLKFYFCEKVGELRTRASFCVNERNLGVDQEICLTLMCAAHNERSGNTG